MARKQASEGKSDIILLWGEVRQADSVQKEGFTMADIDQPVA